MRVKPATRIVGAVLVPILAATTVVLWGWPGETERLFFGWRSTSAGAAAALDGRWSAIRIPCLSQLAGLMLLLVGIVRGRDDLHTDRASTWIYVAVNLAMLALLTWLVATMSPRRAAGSRPPVVPGAGTRASTAP